MLQIDHEQGSALSDDVVLVTGVPESVFKLGRGKPIDDVDCNLQRI